MIEITNNRLNLILNDKVIGYIIYDETTDFIVGTYIFVNPEERGKGYTKVLMDGFVKFVTEKNKKVQAVCPVIKRNLTETNPELLI
ncbi:MAG: GCN5-related N-acetyl-transferase [Haloplasmataceae bacterium]|jgi:predicted GNAT family acetyltransferase|nr:GCN5-related N-acetyl-transferase [Haloplasmataceae bacterium]